jgi:uncharacterized protein YjbI with pentapeptide repeats
LHLNRRSITLQIGPIETELVHRPKLGGAVANQQQVGLLRQGAEVWNKWRIAGPNIQPDLSGANLRKAELRMVHLKDADLHGADLECADLTDADLRGANLDGARLRGAIMYRADVREAQLRFADLTGANLGLADLTGSDLEHATMHDADLFGAIYSCSTRFPSGFDPKEPSAKRKHAAHGMTA